MSALLKPVGLGFGLLGTTNAEEISENEAEDIFAGALKLGISRFDTAPLYGGGLSEERLGRLIAHLPRDSYTLSTKVGRYRPYAEKVMNPKKNPGDFHDYSADATLRSIEASLERLETDYLDIVYIHDCDAHVIEAVGGAFPALNKLKEEGVIGAIGCGSNIAATHLALLSETDLDILMVAGRFTLLDHSAAEKLFPLCLKSNLEVELAAPFNSGILATGSTDLSKRFDYQAPSDSVRRRVREIEIICITHGVSLKAAALCYSALHPAVHRLVLGLIDYPGLESNLSDLLTAPPPELWKDLADIGILSPLLQANA